MSSWQRLKLYHGTDAASATAIRTYGIKLSEARAHTDFGPGFYMTSIGYQAKTWAMGASPDLVEIDVSRYDFHPFKVLHFTIADDSYWEFVKHCRMEDSPHHRCGNESRYDIVIGPVTRDWRDRLIHQGYDQFSFHTDVAVDWLNGALGVMGKNHA